MSCYGCTKSYSIFNRETACNSCGFGFCSSCVKYKTVVPKLGDKEQRVCGSCYNTLRSPAKSVAKSYAPPDALLKRLNTLENPGSTNPIIVYRDNKKMASLRHGLSMDDQKIVDRLEALQRERRGLEATPTDTQVKERLNKLKGISGATASSAAGAVYKPPDTRSAEERTRDLLEGVGAEVELEAKYQPTLSPEADIAARLAKLRGEENPIPASSSSGGRLPDPSQFLASGLGTENISEMSLDSVERMLQSVSDEQEREAQTALANLQKDKAIQEQLERLRIKRGGEAREVATGEEATGDGEDSGDEDKEAEELAKRLLAEEALERRVAGEGAAPATTTSDDDLQDDDDDDDPVVSRLRSLPNPAKEVKMRSEEKEEEPEELPWCVICNADAVLRCRGCEGDLYCRRCYTECHEAEDRTEHSTTQYRK